MKNDVFLGLRIPTDLDTRVKALQDKLSESLSGMKVSKSQLLRNLLERGLDDFEKQLEDGGKNG